LRSPSTACTTTPWARTRGSCQLAFKPELFGAVMPWLIANRDGLTVFAHAETGDALKDHTEHVIWLWPSETLDLSKLS